MRVYNQWAFILALLPIQGTVAQPTVSGQDTKLYYLVFLRPDPARKPVDKAEGERIQAAHMANIRAMAQGGVLLSAGPFEDQPAAISGIFILQSPSLEEATRSAATDPTVIAHRNTVDVHPWRGPAGIGAEYLRLHREHPETPEGMAARPLVMIFRGPKWTEKSEYPERLLSGLRRAGKLSAAGPVEGREELLGIAVFHPGLFDEAGKFFAEDPDVKAGVLRVEVHRWWCSAHVLPWEAD